MTPPPPIALTLLSGPTGAGKTRLLNAVLPHPALAGTLALANEVGETPLDPRFAAPTGSTGSLPGCLCCTARGELAGLLEGLLRHLDNGRIAPFIRLVLETAGDADPAEITGALSAHPYLSRRYGRPNVLVLAGAADAGVRDAWTRQMAVADALILPDRRALYAMPDVPAFDLADVLSDPSTAFLTPARAQSALPEQARRTHYRAAFGRPTTRP